MLTKEDVMKQPRDMNTAKAGIRYEEGPGVFDGGQGIVIFPVDLSPCPLCGLKPFEGSFGPGRKCPDCGQTIPSDRKK